MAKLLNIEHGRLAYLAADRMRRAARSYLLRSPLYQWRTNRFNPDEVIIVPQDLRTADPSFALEVSEGYFGLVGHVAHLDAIEGGAYSPFSILPPNESWNRALHGFSWLRHLGASDHPDATEMARAFVVDWLRGSWAHDHVAWHVDIVTRRAISWLTNSSPFLDGADQKLYDEVMSEFGKQLRFLAAVRHEAYPGYPRLLALTALIYGGLCLSDQRHYAVEGITLLDDELDAQIFDDGGHISRNSNVLIDLILDLMPLKHCFYARELSPPDGLNRALQKMCEMLRYMRLGDGTLGHFNGVGPVSPDSLSTALAYDESLQTSETETAETCYCRLQREKTIILMDVGAVPKLEFSASAHAGCLSFEMSSGRHPLIVNCGAPTAMDEEWLHRSRSTAFHSTLELAGSSSARLVRNKTLEENLGAPPIKEPKNVSYHVRDIGSSVSVESSHDGYHSRFGTSHYRLLELDRLGTRLSGRDKLDTRSMSSQLQGSQFAIHFHIHPMVEVRRAKDGESVALLLPSDERWLFTARGAKINLEDSVYLADFTGAKQSVQIVLRGHCVDEVDVKWALERIASE